MCRRCGAPLHSDEPEVTRVARPPTLARRRSVKGGSGVATPPRPAATPRNIADAAFRRSQPDTLLPGSWSRPDNLLPRPSPSTPERRAASPEARAGIVAKARGIAVRAGALTRKHPRPVLVGVAVGVALASSLVAVWPTVFGSGTNPTASGAAQQARATDLLRTVVGGGVILFAQHHSFTPVSPSALSARSHHVPVVASATNARVGQVSMRGTSSVLTLASPADTRMCVFARDEPGKSEILFVTVRTADCRAVSAPARGWHA
jgi:hypothetical protein